VLVLIIAQETENHSDDHLFAGATSENKLSDSQTKADPSVGAERSVFVSVPLEMGLDVPNFSLLRTAPGWR
jgi:hypothetical protein